MDQCHFVQLREGRVDVEGRRLSRRSSPIWHERLSRCQPTTTCAEASLSASTMPSSSTSAEANVLILYAGGTIGMLQSDKGYVPEPGFLTVSICSSPHSRSRLNWSPTGNAESSVSLPRPDPVLPPLAHLFLQSLPELVFTLLSRFFSSWLSSTCGRRRWLSPSFRRSLVCRR